MTETIKRKKYGGWLYKLKKGDYITFEKECPIVLESEYDCIEPVKDKIDHDFYLVYEDCGNLIYLIENKDIVNFTNKYSVISEGVRKKLVDLNYYIWYQFEVNNVDELCYVVYANTKETQTNWLYKNKYNLLKKEETVGYFKIYNGFQECVDILAAYELKMQFNHAHMSSKLKKLLSNVVDAPHVTKEELITNKGSYKVQTWSFRKDLLDYIRNLKECYTGEEMIDIQEQIDFNNKSNNNNVLYMYTKTGALTLYTFYSNKKGFYCGLNSSNKGTAFQVKQWADNLFFKENKYFFRSNTFSEFCEKVKNILVFPNLLQRLKQTRLMSIDAYMAFSNYTFHDDIAINCLLRTDFSNKVKIDNRTKYKNDNRKLSENSLTDKSYIFRCWLEAVTMHQYINTTQLNDIVLFRGCSYRYRTKEGYYDYCRMNHFVSTSLFPEVASHFLIDAKEDEKPMVCVIRNMAQGIYLQGFTKFNNEYEVLLNCDNIIKNPLKQYRSSKEYKYVNGYPVIEANLYHNINFHLIDRFYLFNHWKDIVLYYKVNSLFFKGDKKTSGFDIRKLRLTVANTDKYIEFVHDLNFKTYTSEIAYFHYTTNIAGIVVTNTFENPYNDVEFIQNFSKWVKSIFNYFKKVNISSKAQNIININDSISFAKTDTDYVAYYMNNLTSVLNANYICVENYILKQERNVIDTNKLKVNRLACILNLYGVSKNIVQVHIIFESQTYSNTNHLGIYLCNDESIMKKLFMNKDPLSYKIATQDVFYKNVQVNYSNIEMFDICRAILRNKKVNILGRLTKAVGLIASFNKCYILDDYPKKQKKNGVITIKYKFNEAINGFDTLVLTITGLEMCLVRNKHYILDSKPYDSPNTIAEELIKYF